MTGEGVQPGSRAEMGTEAIETSLGADTKLGVNDWSGSSTTGAAQ